MALTPKGKELKDLDLDDLLSKLTDAELEELQSELIDPDVRTILCPTFSHHYACHLFLAPAFRVAPGL